MEELEKSVQTLKVEEDYKRQTSKGIPGRMQTPN